MVGSGHDSTEPTRRSRSDADIPLVWRALTAANRVAVRLVGKVEVSGHFPDELRGRPVLIAANHIGMFDPFVLLAACRSIGLAPRFMLTAGLLDAPVMGWFLRRSGHVRVDRGKSNVIEAFGRAVESLRDAKVPLLVYPEGRISHDEGLWPERGKTGVARMALQGDIPVLTISQWGAHEAMYWGTPTVTCWQDLKPLVVSLARAIRDRPRFRVHFGSPVDLRGLSPSTPGDAMRAHSRIMQAIADGMIPLRRDEPVCPRFHDPTRPTDTRSPWKPDHSQPDRSTPGRDKSE